MTDREKKKTSGGWYKREMEKICGVFVT